MQHRQKGCFKKTLAKEITIFVHGEEQYNAAIETTGKLFSKQNASAESLSEDDIENMEGVIKIECAPEIISSRPDVVSFLAEVKIFESKGEARKMIQNGGVSINRKKLKRYRHQ